MRSALASHWRFVVPTSAMPIVRSTVISIAISIAAPIAIAATPLADLAPPRTLRVELRWQGQDVSALAMPAPGSRGGDAGGTVEDARFHEMVASIPNVEHRFDLRTWRGRQVRIDLVMPALIDGLASTQAMRVQWEGGAVLQSGQARPGERVTVFVGRVDSDQLLERLRYTLTIDSRFFDGRVRFKPAFELEAR